MKQLLSAFESHSRYGLMQGTEVALPARYDAVWALPYGFWGFRLGERFGVLAANGQQVSGCELPAVFHGFAQLTVDEELEAFLEPEASYVSFMRQRFPSLHQRYRVLCRPATWLAEEVTHCLATIDDIDEDEDDSLWLNTETCCLKLKSDGTWERYSWTCGVVYYAQQHPANSFKQVLVTQFKPADIEDLLRWRWQMQELSGASDSHTENSYFKWMVADVQQRVACEAELQALLPALGICTLDAEKEECEEGEEEEYVDFNFTSAFDINSFTPETRATCEAHLHTFFEVNADQKYVEQLIYLAWLWANGFVFLDPEDNLHWIDGGYEFDTSLFDHATIDAIYCDYELDKLLPLLYQPDLANE